MEERDRRNQGVRSVDAMVPAVQFSGMTYPRSSPSGAVAVAGLVYPTRCFPLIYRGVFSNVLGFADLLPNLLALSAFDPALTIAGVLLLKKQGRWTCADSGTSGTSASRNCAAFGATGS